VNVAGLKARVKTAFRMLATQGFLWHLPDRKSPDEAIKLRSEARRLIRQRWSALLRPFAFMGAAVLWPLLSLHEARLLRRFGNPDAMPPDITQRAWRAALRHNLPAAEFGAFGMWQDTAAPPDCWLYTRESALLTAHLTNADVADLVGDKVKFAEFCSRHGSMKVATTLAVFRDGQVAMGFDKDLPPETSLVSKPVRTSMGRGFQLWSFQDEGYTTSESPHDRSVSASALTEALCQLSRRHPSGLMVQATLDAHPALSALSNTGPAVARIVTGRWRNGNVEVLDAMLQRPTAGAYKTHGGPFRLIDTASGQMVPRQPPPHVFPTATDDAAFDHIALPDWNDCTSELNRLHAAIDGQAPLLGWDVVFTSKGPTILEANTTLAPYFFQLGGQRPAANGKWTSLLAGYLP
jgi:hypothetical protein